MTYSSSTQLIKSDFAVILEIDIDHRYILININAPPFVKIPTKTFTVCVLL